MLSGWRVCAYLWMTFFVLWMGAALFTKRAAVRISWQRGLRYGIPVVAGYYLMFSMKLDIAWLQYRLLPRSEALDICHSDHVSRDAVCRLGKGLSGTELEQRSHDSREA
jgi:hypothetical protein